MQKLHSERAIDRIAPARSFDLHGLLVVSIERPASGTAVPPLAALSPCDSSRCAISAWNRAYAAKVETINFEKRLAHLNPANATVASSGRGWPRGLYPLPHSACTSQSSLCSTLLGLPATTAAHRAGLERPAINTS